MIHIECYKCDRSLSEPGALIFTPPLSSEPSAEVRKIHICTDCWNVLFVDLLLDSPPRSECGGAEAEPEELISDVRQLRDAVLSGLDKLVAQFKAPRS